MGRQNNQKKAIIVIVGYSGAGKSTFIDKMKIPDNYKFVTSQPMIDYLKEQEEEINHDTIFSISEKWYEADPLWLFKEIERLLKNKNYIVIDGPRRIEYIRALQEKYCVIIIGIRTSLSKRFNRLQKRQKIPVQNIEEFKRLEKDEKKNMRVEKIMKMADIVIENNTSINNLEEEGKLAGLLIKKLKP